MRADRKCDDNPQTNSQPTEQLENIGPISSTASAADPAAAASDAPAAPPAAAAAAADAAAAAELSNIYVSF